MSFRNELRYLGLFLSGGVLIVHAPVLALVTAAVLMIVLVVTQS